MSARDQLHAAMLAARELDEYLTAVWSCPGGVPEPIDRAMPRPTRGCIVGPRLVEIGPDDLVVNVPEDVRDDLVHFLQWRNSADHQRASLWVGSSMGEVTLAVARAVADARGIPRDGQGATS